jgi:hypothetical protein
VNSVEAVAGDPTSHRSSITSRLALRENYIHAVVLTLLPWACLAFNRDWIYSASGMIDPWLYHGYFHRFPEFVSTLYAGLYYGTRLAWIVPGYLAYSLLPPHAANLALHLALYYVAVCAVYRVVAILGDRSRALVAAVAFGTFWQVLISLGWDYVDGAVIAYSSVAWACLVSAARSPLPVRYLVAAGAASAAMVHSNLGALFLVPGVLMSYVVLRGRDTIRSRCFHAGAWLSGVVLVTAALGAIDAWAGGSWLFFTPSVQWSSNSIGAITFAPQVVLRWPSAAQLIVPALGGLVAVRLLVWRRSTPAIATSLPILVTWALFVVFDGAFKGGLLQTQYYVSWLLVPAFVAMAVAYPAGRSRMTTGSAVFIAFIWALNWLVAPRLPFHGDHRSRAQFELVQQTIRFVSTRVPIGRGRPIFWLQQGSANRFVSSLASTHLYLYSLAGTDYPALPDDVTKFPRFGATIQPGSTVVVVSYNPPTESIIEREFARFGLSARVGVSEQIQADSVKLRLSVVEVGKREQEP